MNVSENELIEMQEETNRIIESISSQKLDSEHTSWFIYALFAVVAISMVFENFVRAYREEKRNKKKAGEPLKDIRIKLLITYAVHFLAMILIWVICKFALGFTSPYILFLLAITIYIVEIGPLFSINLKFKKKEENK